MIFNRAFLKNNLKPGTVITVIGKYDALKNTDIDYRTCDIEMNLSKQSPDIALGVDKCMEEKKAGNLEFEMARKTTKKTLDRIDLSEVQDFLQEFVLNPQEFF